MNPQQNNSYNYNFFFTYAILGLAALIVLLSFPEPITKIAADQGQHVAAAAAALPPKNYFASTTLHARAAYVYDFSTGKVLYARNENLSLPLASLTKIMTAMTAEKLATASTTIVISAENLAEEGDTGLYVDEYWALPELLKFTLMVSSNDGARAIASAFGGRELFIQEMNHNAQVLGLKQARFVNESGLDESATAAGAYGSAKDMAKLLNAALEHYPGTFAATGKQDMSLSSDSGFTHYARNTNILASDIPGLKAGKTGFSNLAGGNLAVLFEAAPGHTVAVVVLGSTYDGRFQDVEKLVNNAVAAVTEE